MIVDINIKQLGTLAADIKSLLNECDEAELNIFNQLKDVCNNWRDGNSAAFEEKKDEEKKQTQDFFAALENNQKLFSFVYDEYKSIGNKLYLNLEKKDAIINALDNCINNANNVIYELDRAERSFYYYELSLINNQRSAMYTVRDELKNLKTTITNLYKKVKQSEERISNKISKLEEIRIKKFNFEFK